MESWRRRRSTIMEWQGEFSPTLRPRGNFLHKANNILRRPRHRTAINSLLIRHRLQQLRSELGYSGNSFVRREKGERAPEASTDLHEIVADSDESLRRRGGVAGGRRRRRGRRSEEVSDAAENKRYVVLDAVAIGGGGRRRRRRREHGDFVWKR